MSSYSKGSYRPNETNGPQRSYGNQRPHGNYGNHGNHGNQRPSRSWGPRELTPEQKRLYDMFSDQSFPLNLVELLGSPLPSNVPQNSLKAIYRIFDTDKKPEEAKQIVFELCLFFATRAVTFPKDLNTYEDQHFQQIVMICEMLRFLKNCPNERRDPVEIIQAIINNPARSPDFTTETVSHVISKWCETYPSHLTRSLIAELIALFDQTRVVSPFSSNKEECETERSNVILALGQIPTVTQETLRLPRRESPTVAQEIDLQVKISDALTKVWVELLERLKALAMAEVLVPWMNDFIRRDVPDHDPATKLPFAGTLFVGAETSSHERRCRLADIYNTPDLARHLEQFFSCYLEFFREMENVARYSSFLSSSRISPLEKGKLKELLISCCDVEYWQDFFVETFFSYYQFDLLTSRNLPTLEDMLILCKQIRLNCLGTSVDSEERQRLAQEIREDKAKLEQKKSNFHARIAQAAEKRARRQAARQAEADRQAEAEAARQAETVRRDAIEKLKTPIVGLAPNMTMGAIMFQRLMSANGLAGKMEIFRPLIDELCGCLEPVSYAQLGAMYNRFLDDHATEVYFKLELVQPFSTLFTAICQNPEAYLPRKDRPKKQRKPKSKGPSRRS